MRLIGTLDDEREALTFSYFLQRKGVLHQIEIKTDTDWESTSYGSNVCQIWIYEEDQMQDVMQWFDLFLENPEDPFFSLLPKTADEQIEDQSTPLAHSDAIPPPSPTVSFWEKQPMGLITRSLLLICCSLFFLSNFLTAPVQIPERYARLILFTSPIEKALLYDYPKFYELLDRFIDLYGFEKLENPKELTPEGKQLLKQLNQTLFWPGFYHLILKEGWDVLKKGFGNYPTFEKIREGQLWRLFTPCLLHGDLFHLFFNMIWLIILGKQIEQRLGPWRYILFMLIVGVISNTGQYLMSGSNFIGFSGILCGMLAFIWTRQQIAAWEGYEIDKITLIFMLIFILGLASLQFLSFFLEKIFDFALSPNIANMAHLTGGLMGFLLARLNFFSWRHA